MKNQISIVVTGTAWMGSGIGSIETTLERLFREAEKEIGISIYSISSKTDLIFMWLETALNRGIQIRIVINKIENQPRKVVKFLLLLKSKYPHFHLYNFNSVTGDDLHAKLVVVDREKALVGSSNFSRRGLITNHELAIVIEGESAENVANVLDRLISSHLIQEINS